MIITRAPMRICLAGGGTDLRTFSELHDTIVLSMAIDKYVYITMKKNCLDDSLRLQYSKTEVVEDVSLLEHDRARTTLDLYRIRNGYEITSIADLPSNTGLGSSSTYLVALLTAMRTEKRMDISPQTLAQEACRIEIDLLKEPIGIQDQYISAYGGIREIEIEQNYPWVKDVNIPINGINSFINNAHMYYLNVRRSASDVLKEQNSGKSEKTLLKIRDMAYKFKEALEKQNFDDYGLLLDEYWQEKKKLSNKVSISAVDEIYDLVKKEYNVLGGKIVGAGGGGFLMLYCNKDHMKLENFMNSLGYKRMLYQPDYRGARVVAEV